MIAEGWELGIGARIRSSREERGLTTRALASLAGLSQSLLSDIENGRALPSVASLYAIAEALGTGPAELLPQDDDTARLTEHGVPLPPEGLGEAVSTRMLYGAPGRRIEVYLSTYPPGQTDPEPFQHSGEDIIMVLEGRMTLTVGDRDEQLRAGDAAWLDSSAPHSIQPQGRADLQIIVITAR
ncbi:helix-turn-helix domain-containing protein [Agreia sp. PsM10]|uniref:helix-turn-helix domain-containing protein n=1 Tax=Agreia sp. PsM10 TaxID=3030533 RepID=UPI00263B03DF|nr:helix-turn-helix domain-containing protein [Agreia sp. PsM10]MDN4639384.1 helix-turn-helix domain-containing protein [Agreia sp. PsM10]